MKAFIDDHRHLYGVEPICKVLPIAPSTYRNHDARRRDPDRLPARAKRDAALSEEIKRVFNAISSFMGCARSGASCSAKAMMSDAALLPD